MWLHGNWKTSPSISSLHPCHPAPQNQQLFLMYLFIYFCSPLENIVCEIVWRIGQCLTRLLHPLYLPRLVLHAIVHFVIPRSTAPPPTSALSQPHLGGRASRGGGQARAASCKHIYCVNTAVAKRLKDSNRCLSTAGQISSALKDLCCRRGLVSPGIVCLLIPSPRYLWKTGMNN